VQRIVWDCGSGAPLVAQLDLENVSKAFDGEPPLTAVQGLTFTVEPGEFLSIVGPSGCGKSTILNMVAGLAKPSEGEIRIDGERVEGPSQRVAFMLQKDLLLPWRTILQNAEFGLEGRISDRAERRRLALAELERCRISEFAGHYPHQLSGGMRQRAALSRTLAVQPDLILLDEPFSALDAQTKLLLQRSFAEMLTGKGITTVLITHDLTEAVMMSDRVIVLSDRPGRIVLEMKIELPNRGDPLVRRSAAGAQAHIDRLFGALHLDERSI
jgi:NitT/TauT family transport system ATP-binding protein